MDTFFLEKKIYYHDTDAGGVVYYARYLEHLEEARAEYCRVRGIDLVKLFSEGIVFPVVHLEIDYKSPARYGDCVRIYTKPEKVGNASVHFKQEIKKGETTILSAKTVWACVTSSLKIQRVPEEVRSKLV
ncbi:MAG TPA: thioesterase family protein [Candidatus Omnitrophota bacterium]|nr:thioesterase family protein [Candidatus Omnitrophota bacterium]